MQVAITFRHMETDEGVKAYVKEKLQKLQKYVENPREVHVVLTVEKFRHIAEITIVADGGTFNSEGRDNDLYAAVDQMVEKMERQMRERREKVRRKKGRR
jgi:putative sigma-54 modulation protein